MIVIPLIPQSPLMRGNHKEEGTVFVPRQRHNLSYSAAKTVIGGHNATVAMPTGYVLSFYEIPDLSLGCWRGRYFIVSQAPYVLRRNVQIVH